MYRLNVGSQAVFAQMNSRTDGSPLTTSVSVNVTTGAGGAQGAGGGTLTHMGNGQWRYVPTQAETNASVLAVQFTHASGVNVTLTLLTTAADPGSAERGLAGTALPAVAAGANGGLPLGNASGAVTLASATHTGAVIPTVTTLTNDPSGVTTLLARLGAFTGTGINTVLGFLRALGRKDASLTPSDMGGTYDNTTDSLESIRDSAATTSDMQTAMQTVVENNHLDHLLAVDYDPASKPGVATALLNELVESDAGVSRFTTNALENAPAGGGGGTSDWSSGEREQIRHRLGIDGTASAPSATPSLATAAAASAIEADTQDIQSRLPAALVSGRIDASVGAMAANVMTAAAAAADLTTELQSGLATAASLSSVATQVAAIEVDTQDIQSRLPAALVGGRIDANAGAISGDATAADNLEAALDGTGGVSITAGLTGNVTGNLSGSVGSVTAGVTLANNAVSAAALAADAGAEIADAVLDEVVVGTYTLRQLMRVIAAAAAGKLSGAATTEITIRDLGDTKDVVVATVDADGNRTNVVVDAT